MSRRLGLAAVVTSAVLNEFRLLQQSVELFHSLDAHWHVRCDDAVAAALEGDSNVTTVVFCPSPGIHYESSDRSSRDHFNALVSQKMNAIGDAWARGADAVAYLDADIVVTANFLERLLDTTHDVVLTLNHYPASRSYFSSFHGHFNSGFVFTVTPTFHEAWRDAFRSQPWLFTDQGCLDELARRFAAGILEENANVGFWRSPSATAFAYLPIPGDCQFLHVHGYRPLGSARGWFDRTFSLHCLQYLLSTGRPKHRRLADLWLAQDSSGWYEASLALIRAGATNRHDGESRALAQPSSAEGHSHVER